MEIKNNKFYATHINIRQGISFLILKLVITEIVFIFLLYSVAFPHSFLDNFFLLFQQPNQIRLILFLLLALCKFYFEFISVYQWLNEYYEISCTQIVHRKGFIFRKEQCYDYKQVRLVDLKQNFIARLLNYGTIHMFDPYAHKNIYLYLIHNPLRYYKIIKSLIPRVDDEREIVSLRKTTED
jgi:hypothetical protein